MDFPNGIGLLQTINLCGISSRRESFYIHVWSVFETHSSKPLTVQSLIRSESAVYSSSIKFAAALMAVRYYT
jgi:hypothetical protein